LLNTKLGGNVATLLPGSMANLDNLVMDYKPSHI